MLQSSIWAASLQQYKSNPTLSVAPTSMGYNCKNYIFFFSFFFFVNVNFSYTAKTKYYVNEKDGQTVRLRMLTFTTFPEVESV